MSKEMATILDEVRNEGKEEWMQKGMLQGEIDTFIKIYKNGLIKADEAARLLNISCNDFMQLVEHSNKPL